MKIAFILPSLANNGPIVFTKYLIEGLRHKVDLIEVFYFDDKCEIDLGVNCRQIGFLEKIHWQYFDVIHTTQAKPDLFGWLNKAKLKNRWVCSMHNYYKEDLFLLYGSPKSKILSLIWKISLLSVRNVIVSSQEMLDYYSKDIGRKNFEIIPYGIQKKNLTDALLINEHQILLDLKKKYTVIGSVGLLIRRKGFHQLVEFLKYNENYAVVIIGDGVERAQLELLAKQGGVSNRFLLLGFKHDSIEYYRYFDIYAMTSSSEGFGLAMLEAMSQSLPVVCSKLNIYNNYFTNDDVCFFEVDDDNSLKFAISEATNKLDHYKKASYNLYLNKFSLSSMADKHIAYYKKLSTPN